MNTKSLRFKLTDVCYILLMILPLAAAITLKVLFSPASSGIEISGALVYFTVHLPLQDLPVSESQVNTWLVLITLLGLCLYLTHGISAKGGLRRQIVAEWIVGQTEKLVRTNMGEYFMGFSPFIAAIMGLSAFSSLQSLLGLYAPTSDLNVTAGWAILVFILITFYKLKCGPLHYLKSFAEPVPFFAPMNLISEVATPVSMAFRHYGNVLSGSVISVLIATALQGLTKMVLGWLPGFLGQFPFFQIGIPAIFSIYFDIFSGCLQAFIFAMLTMLYVSGGFPAAEYFARQEKKRRKKAGKASQS